MSETFEANQPMNSGSETASSTAASALKAYREGTGSKKPFTEFKDGKKEISGKGHSVQTITEQPSGVDERHTKEPDTVQYKEKDLDPNANVKNSGEEVKKAESKDGEESPSGEESENKVEDRKSVSTELEKDAATKLKSEEVDVENEVKTTDRTDELLKRLEALETAKQREAEEARKAERLKQIKSDQELVSNDFKFEYDVSSILSLDDVPDSVRDYVLDDEQAAQTMQYLITDALNKLVKDFSGYGDAQERVQQFQMEEAEAQRQTVVRGLTDRGIDVNVFNSKEFKAFEQDPKNFKQIDNLAERFGFGSLEFSHLVHDMFQASLKSKKSETAKATRSEAEAARQKIAQGQETAAQGQVVGGRATEKVAVDPQSPEAKLAAYRAQRSKRF